MVALAPDVELASSWDVVWEVTDCKVFVWGEMDFGGRGVPDINAHVLYAAHLTWALRHTTLRRTTAGGARQVNNSVPTRANITRREMNVVRRRYGI